MTTKQATLCIGVVFLAFSAQHCTTARVKPTQTVLGQKSEGEPGAVSPSTPDSEPSQVWKPEPEPEPGNFLRDRDRAVDLVLKDARLLFERGKALFESGQTEEGRFFFDESLALIHSSGFAPADYPRLEHVLDDLQSDIRRVEITVLAERDEPSLPTEEELSDSLSPLDEIANLDLFEAEIDPALEDRVGEDLRSIKFDFPVVVNKEVLRFLEYYQGRGRKAMEGALKRSGHYMPEFQRIFQEEGLPQDLIYMAHVESLFKTKAYSRAHARGIWQFVKGTGRLYGLSAGWWVDERLDVLKATRSAARHLRDLKEEFGDWYLALAGYNGGPGRVSRVLRRYGKLDYWEMARRKMLPRETRNYVPSILAAIIIYKHPEQYGFDQQPDPPLQWENVRVDFQVDLRVIADAIGISQEALVDLNPQLLRGITPPGDEGYYLNVPLGTGELAQQKLAEIPPEKRLRLQHHKVRKGETLSHIASKYGISIRAIAETNRLRNVNRLSLGQDLIIPLSDWRALAGASGEDVDPVADKHTVRRGDSLYKIARSYGVSLENLFRWNNLGPRSVLRPGQEIRVKAATGSAR